jgi:ATP-dependent DNA helicase Q4
MEKELKQIDDAIQESKPELTDDDKAAYEIPKTDEGYLKVLKERFGHDSFKEGQLEAIKIILERKDNALVVLATGGGKSLIY